MDIELGIKTYATILLVIRIISMVFMGLVLNRQIELFQRPIEERVRNFRKTLFLLALLIFIGNITPAIIDILTMSADLTRGVSRVGPVSLVYTMDASLTSLLSSFLIWTLYKQAKDTNDETDHSDKDMLSDYIAKPKRRRKS